MPRVCEVAQAAGLQVVVATGIYAFLELPGFLAYRPTSAIASLFVREITEGIDDTGVKAAF
jgi:phosphotriesterase-related protein